MIILNKNYPYGMSSEYADISKRLDYFYFLLTESKKPAISKILKEIKDGNIKLRYNKRDNDPRILIEEKNNKISVNISTISKDIDNAIEKKTIPLGTLYSYLVQAYVVLNWNKLKTNRTLLQDALNSYGDMILNIMTHKGLGIFRNDKEKAKAKFLSIWYVIKKSDLKISEPTELAKRISRYTDDDLVDKYKDTYDDKELSYDMFLTQILQNEFSFMNKIESANYLVHVVYRIYGPTAAMMLDDIKYYPALCMDFVQTTNPIVYRTYPGLTNIINKTAYHNIYSSITSI